VATDCCGHGVVLATRVCFTSDLHGDVRLYEQLGELLRAEMPDLLVLGGDLFRDVDRDAPVLPQVARMVQELMHRVRLWCDGNPRLRVACVAGNHEIVPIREALEVQHAAGRLMLLSRSRPWHYAGLVWLGYECTPPSPHWAKDFERCDVPDDPPPAFDGVEWDPAQQRLREVTAAEYFARQPSMVAELADVVTPAQPWVLVAHAPPYDSRLDRLFSVAHPIGSQAVRRFIEERRPVLSLHGHVHESPQVTGAYIDQIGQTLAINPGQGHERLHAVLFDLERPTGTLRHTVFT